MVIKAAAWLVNRRILATLRVGVTVGLLGGCSSTADDGTGSASRRVDTVAPALPYRARGNEPGWTVEIGRDTIALSARYGELNVSGPRPAAQVADRTVRYLTQANGGVLDVEIAPGPCVDTMSGMPYPDAVSVRYAGEVHNGCGGDPAALLTDDEWAVVDLPGGVIDGSPITIAFDDDGNVSGHASCNRFRGSYALTGETLTLTPMTTTRMACEPASLEQEQRLLSTLEKVVTFKIGSDGALILKTDDGRSITARQLPAGGEPAGVTSAANQAAPE